VRTKLLAEAQLGGHVHAGIEENGAGEIQREIRARSAVVAAICYLSWKTAQLDFNYSISNYPRTVRDLIAEAIPWTLGLLGMTTLLSFGIGTFLARCWHGRGRRAGCDM